MRLRLLALLVAASLAASPAAKRAAADDAPGGAPRKAAVADLVVDLGAAEPHLREQARDGLVRIGAAAVPDVVRVLETGSLRARIEAARALGAIGAPSREAVPALEKAAGSTDAALSAAAKEALSAIDPERFGPSAGGVAIRVADLVPALASKDAATKRETIRRLGEVRGDDAPRAAAALGALLSEKSAATRVDVLQALASLGEAAAAEAPRVVDVLDDPERKVRSWGLFALAFMRGAGAAPALHRLARLHESQDDPRAVEPWLEAVLWNAGPAAGSEARAALGGDDVFLAAAGADALGAIRPIDAPSVAALVAALSGRPAIVRRRAAVALGAQGAAATDAAIDGLVAVLADRESRAQVEAATALRRILADVAERPARPTNVPAEVRGAIEAGLAWLAAHQDDDGRFDADGFMDHDPADDRCDGPGEKIYDTGVTALAVLAFARSGATGRVADDESPVDTALRRGMAHLGWVQDGEGCFGPRDGKHWIYGHAIATLASVEAYRASRHPVWGRMAQRGLDFLAAARNPEGAWRYGVRPEDTDTSVNGWVVQALRAGERAGLRVDRAGYAAVLSYLDATTDRATGLIGYKADVKDVARMDEMKKRFPPSQSRAMVASASLQRLLLGRTPGGDDLLRKGIERTLELPPVWDTASGRIDLYSWLAATEAAFLAGGDTWRRWKTPLREALLVSQHAPGNGARSGSWDPADPWGTVGGRVYSTSAAVLCLEVHNGHLAPLPVRDAASEGRGLKIARALQAAAKDSANHETVRAAAE